MGQKVNPNGLRIGINKDWEAKWYANKSDFSKYLNNDVEIRKYLSTNFKAAGISKIVIERNKKRCEVFIYASKPGIIIGQSGVEIEKVKKAVSKLVNEDVQISIVEVKNPDLDARLVADNIAHNIENRVSFRVAQKKAIRNTMKAGAKGIKTLVSGRLGGADIARGFLSSYVLFTRLQCKYVGLFSIGIHRLPCYASGKLADELLPAAKKAQIRSAGIQRNAQTLGLSAGQIGSPFPWCPDDSQGGRVGIYRQKRLGVMHGISESGKVFYDTVTVYPGDKHTGHILAPEFPAD